MVQCWQISTVVFVLSLNLLPSSSVVIVSIKNKNKSQNKGRERSPPYGHNNGSRCSLFVGSWVRDNTYPLYEYTCPYIDPEFNCQMYGRPDTDYLKYRWQPTECTLPRFNGVEYLTRMRGKRVMFVGDSLGMNQWQSLICMITADAPEARTQSSRGDPLSSLVFLDYGVTLSFYRATYLVDIDVVQGKRVLKLDEIAGNANGWLNADVLSFNTGHWWNHFGSLQGWDLMESGGTYYKDMDRAVALEKAMNTWADWVDSNIDRSRTVVFFLAISPTHYDPGEWSGGGGTGKNCYGEKEPLRGTSYPGAYPYQWKVVNSVIGEMKHPAFVLDITELSELRKDGHPSIFSGDLSAAQKSNPNRYADCSHWCLPGLPDTWNQLVFNLLFS